jgi:hypothetical protein
VRHPATYACAIGWPLYGGMSSDDDGSLSERTIVPISKAMLEEVDDWRYANRVPSKAEAMRRLIRAGLDATKTKSRRK